MFSCPECGGSLWEAEETGLLRYRCHVGHSYTGEALVDRGDGELEQALWTALRSLEEAAELRRRMANHARERLMVDVASEYLERAADFEERASIIRRVLVTDRPDDDRDDARIVGARARRAAQE